MKANDDTRMPCAEALVAGTVALMTTWADPCPQARLDAVQQRALMARQVVSNLALLSRHPALSPELRQVMAMARDRWAGLSEPTEWRRAGPAERHGTLH
jgi:hypothetical protein